MTCPGSDNKWGNYIPFSGTDRQWSANELTTTFLVIIEKKVPAATGLIKMAVWFCHSHGIFI